jgi:hypothetical protein
MWELIKIGYDKDLIFYDNHRESGFSLRLLALMEHTTKYGKVSLQQSPMLDYYFVLDRTLKSFFDFDNESNISDCGFKCMGTEIKFVDGLRELGSLWDRYISLGGTFYKDRNNLVMVTNGKDSLLGMY